MQTVPRKSQANVLTIANKHGSSAVPSVEQLLLQHNLRDHALGGPVDHVSHRQHLSILAADQLEVTDFVAHRFGSLWSPLRVAGALLRFVRVFLQDLDNEPTQRVLITGKGSPLDWDIGLGEVVRMASSYTSCFYALRPKTIDRLPCKIHF